MDDTALRQFVTRLAERARDGLSWADVAASLLELARLASEMAVSLGSLSNEQKQALVVRWVLAGFDAAAAAMTAGIGTWWLIPIAAIVRSVLVQALPGIVDFVYQRAVKK